MTMSSSPLQYYFNGNAACSCCIALRKTSDLYKYCVEYFLFEISVICTPLCFFKKTFLLMYLYEDILYLCECKQQTGSQSVYSVFSVWVMAVGVQGCLSAILLCREERELWSVLMLWRLCLGFVAQSRDNFAQAVTQVNTGSRKTYALTLLKKIKHVVLLPKGRVSLIYNL